MPARLGVDVAMARVVLRAVTAYRDLALVPQGLPVPEHVDELLAYAQNVVDNGGQFAPVSSPTGDHRTCGDLLPLVVAADVARVSVRTLRRRRDDGELTTLLVGGREYIEPAELLRWCGSRRKGRTCLT